MYVFRTHTGSIFTVENGRITRDGDHRILGLPRERGALVRRPFRVLNGGPVVGRRFSFQPTGFDCPITTSVVEAVAHASDFSGHEDAANLAHEAVLV